MTESTRKKLRKVDWRLGRAIALVAIGAAMHLPLPGQAVTPVPPTPPLDFANATPRSSAPRLQLERTTIFAPAAAELQRRSQPERKDVVPANSLGVAGRSRSASLINMRPAELRETPVSTSGVTRTGELSSAADVVRPASPGNDKPPERTERPESPLPPVDPLSSSPALRASHAPNESSRPATDPAGTAAGMPPPSEEDRVRRLLDEYAGAYARLDVGAAQAVYPSVDEKALKKAFAQLASQRVTLQSCGITISGSTANAICRGTATYQPRIGTRPVQIASREWTFDLSKKDTAWKIVHTFVR